MKTLMLVWMFILLSIAASVDIRPIFAGTLQLDDKILRLNTCIFKNISLPLTKQTYESNGKIGVIAAISAMSMDQHFSFQFRYEILCPATTCFIDFVMTRHTVKVREDFLYKMSIDFMVAEGLKSADLNMTYNRADFSLASLPVFKNGAEEIGKQQEWEMFLLPNGFNNVSLTGIVSGKRIANSDKFAITANHAQSGELVQWPLNKNFVLYKVVLIKKAKEEGKIMSDSCRSNNVFDGFLKTRQESVDFDLSKRQNDMALFQAFSMPLECVDFSDQRKPLESIPSYPPSQSMNYIFLIIPFLLAEIAFLLYKKKNRSNPSSPILNMPDLLISFEASHASMDTKAGQLEIPPASSETTEQT